MFIGENVGCIVDLWTVIICEHVWEIWIDRSHVVCNGSATHRIHVTNSLSKNQVHPKETKKDSGDDKKETYKANMKPSNYLILESKSLMQNIETIIVMYYSLPLG